MNQISIVTAFFDIGRGEWSADKGLPHYLKRTNDTYLERFSHMAKLKNEMVVFTSEEFKDKILELRGENPTHVICLDFGSSFAELREKITQIQNSDGFKKIINPSQIKNPEYWNADYVIVNMMKSSFVRSSIERGLVTNELVAWLDFGYCRSQETTSGSDSWYYPFESDKIHFFNIKDYVEGTYISDIISNNDVHITGPCIVAGKQMWPILEELVFHSTNELLKNGLIDDDQTLLLMSYLLKPEFFKLHKIEDDWFMIFRKYNENLPALHS